MDSNDDFQHIFGGRQDWQQQEPEVARPPGERREGKKQFVATLGNAPDRSQQQQDVQEQKKKHARIDDQEKGSQTMIFPIKLHRLLENGDGDSAAIVSWQPHGRAFLVHNKEAFVQRFLPSCFRQSMWASFQRQLNIYGFQRLTAGRDRGAYFHDLFLRGHPELAPRIHRMKLKGIGQGRHRTNAELEPNFYRMKPVGAGDRIDPSTIGMQPNASAAAVALTASASSPPSSNTTAPGTSTINVLQLLGGGGVGTPSQGHAAASNLVATGGNSDLNNIFFLTNGNDLASLQNLGNVTMSGSGANALMDVYDSGMGMPQEGLQSSQHLSLLANIFSAAKTNNSGNPNGGSEPPAHINQHNRRSSIEAQENNNDDLHQWSASNLFAGNSSLAPLLQNSDTNLLTTATLMQYITADSASPERGLAHGQSGPTASRPVVPSASRSTAQSPWTGLAATGLAVSGTSHQPTSLALPQGDNSLSANSSASQGRVLSGSNSSNDLVNTFQLDGPSLRRMSAAAVSTLLSAANNNTNSSVCSHTFDSSPNLLLFSSLHHSRNSSSNLVEASPDSPATFSATQALNRLSAAHPSNNTTVANNFRGHGHPPAPAPASQQVMLLNVATNGGQVAGIGGQSGYVFADLSTRNAAPNGQPTFLDSVYEPIPIKDDTNATGTDVVVSGSNAGQQKLSPGTNGAGSTPSQRLSGQNGFQHFPSDRR